MPQIGKEGLRPYQERLVCKVELGLGRNGEEVADQGKSVECFLNVLSMQQLNYGKLEVSRNSHARFTINRSLQNRTLILLVHFCSNCSQKFLN